MTILDLDRRRLTVLALNMPIAANISYNPYSLNTADLLDPKAQTHPQLARREKLTAEKIHTTTIAAAVGAVVSAGQ